MSGLGTVGAFGDKGLRLPLTETFRLAWADPELRPKILFVLAVFGVYALGVAIPVPISGVAASAVMERLQRDIPFFDLLNLMGGGALRRVSIFALGLNPYITASIVMQILTTAIPGWKKELQEGGQYARQQQNRRTRFLCLFLCIAQSWGLLHMISAAVPLTFWQYTQIAIFWTAGSMLLLWMGEQVSEKGIGNGVSLMIFAGIMISFPTQIHRVGIQLVDGVIMWWQVVLLAIIFVATTWGIVMFTIAQRRIPIQHMRRQMGTRVVGGHTSYLPFTLNLAGVIPIIFAISIVYMPMQFAAMFPEGSTGNQVLMTIGRFMMPTLSSWNGIIACLVYAAMIFFFTYFWSAIQYNVEDIANNLKRAGSFIPGVRPGKQTRDFLDGVISRITLAGATFLAAVALLQYIATDITRIQQVGYFFGTSILIMVSVALETMRQIEANLLMRQYGS